MLFFAWFACSDTLTPFCVEELRAAATTIGVHIKLIELPPWLCADSSVSSFCVFDAESVAVVKKIAKRCMLLRAIYRLFAAAPSVESLLVCLRNNGKCNNNNNNSENTEEGKWLYGMPSKSLNDQLELSPNKENEEEKEKEPDGLRVETFGRHYTQDEKISVAASVFAAMRGLPTSSDSLPSSFFYSSSSSSIIAMEHALEKAPAGAPALWQPTGRVLRVLFGRLVTNAPRALLLTRYNLKQRPYIGTTTMPPEPAFVMVHFAAVKRGGVVMDPFCGTGGILVAAAHYGAITIGADADGRAMQRGTQRGMISPQQKQQREVAMRSHSREELQRAQISEEEASMPSFVTNFKLYGLTSPDRVRLNFANWREVLRLSHTDKNNVNNNKNKNNNSMSRSESMGDCGFLDAIITDPPYGIREPRKKATIPQPQPKEEEVEGKVKDESKKESSCYPVSSIVLDLILFAAESLVVGGRLVLWYPTTSVYYTDDELPTHPSLRLLANIPQRISLKVVRRLIVMEKISPLPFPPPTREECAAVRLPQDLRPLMDTTEMPENSDYMQYRAKVQRRREANQHYFSTVASSNSTCDNNNDNQNNNTNNNNSSIDGKAKRKKMSKTERQERMVANRERNIKLRQQHHQTPDEKKIDGIE